MNLPGVSRDCSSKIRVGGCEAVLMRRSCMIVQSVQWRTLARSLADQTDAAGGEKVHGGGGGYVEYEGGGGGCGGGWGVSICGAAWGLFAAHPGEVSALRNHHGAKSRHRQEVLFARLVLGS